MATLEVVLKGKIADLEKALQKARNELKQTGEAAETTGKKVDQSSKKGFNNLKKSTANVTPTLLEFNRTIQDAPFGIQGVANNIQQLTANFGDLRKRTGSTGSALKALLAGFSGPAGILFVVSTATALFQVFGKEIAASANKYGELKQALDSNIGSAKAQVTILQTLVDTARNVNKSTESRQRAIDKINDLYGEYLPKLDRENIATDAVTKAIDRLNDSLIRQAKIRGLQAAVEEKYKGLAEEIAKIQGFANTSASTALREQNKEIRQQISGYETLLVSLRAQQAEGKNVDAAIESTQAKVDSLTKTILGAGQDIRKQGFLADVIKSQTAESQKEIDNFVNVLKSLVNEDLDLGGIFTSVKEPKLPKFKNNFKNLDDVFGIKEAVQKSLDLGDGTFQAIELTFDQFGNTIGGALDRAGTLVKPKLTAIQESLNEFNQQANQIIQTGIVNTFSGIGQAIGESLVNGTNAFASVGATLLKVIGQVAVQLGEAAIGIGVSMLAIKASFSNPFSAIAAGVALVALGSALGAIANNALNPNSGGSGSIAVSGQGSRGSSFSGSSFQGSGGGFGDGRVVFEIAGQKLLGVLENTRTANSKIGGNIG